MWTHHIPLFKQVRKVIFSKLRSTIGNFYISFIRITKWILPRTPPNLIFLFNREHGTAVIYFEKEQSMDTALRMDNGVVNYSAIRVSPSTSLTSEHPNLTLQLAAHLNISVPQASSTQSHTTSQSHNLTPQKPLPKSPNMTLKTFKDLPQTPSGEVSPQQVRIPTTRHYKGHVISPNATTHLY